MSAERRARQAGGAARPAPGAPTARLPRGRAARAREGAPGGTPSGTTALATLVAAVTVLGGCLWAPKLEDRWTRVDLASASLTPAQAVPTGSPLAVQGRATVTYRRILTGVVVAELRATSTLSPAALAIHPAAERVPMARAIETLLANSVSLGRDTRLVTGWDHLIQPFDFAFTASVPAVLDSAGVPIGAARGVFLVCYLGTGTEVRLPDGSDSLAVTPMPHAQYQVLPVGMTLTVAGSQGS